MITKPTVTYEDTKEAHAKAEYIAKSFLEQCVKERLTVYELEQVKKVLPEMIDLKIQEITFRTKLS